MTPGIPGDRGSADPNFEKHEANLPRISGECGGHCSDHPHRLGSSQAVALLVGQLVGQLWRSRAGHDSPGVVMGCIALAFDTFRSSWSLAFEAKPGQALLVKRTPG